MFARSFISAVVLAFTLAAVAAEPFGNDGIDRTDPNFVRASLLVMGPGEELYSCAGHACLRLECPKFKLDYCFSYESEAVRDRVWSFLSGKLKMGMMAVPTADFLKPYREEGRGVVAYPLDLPSDAKQRLWKLLDEKAAEGAELQYDFIKRGCAQSTMQYLFEAIRPYPIAYPPFAAKYDKTLRELFGVALADHPWNLFILNFLVGTDVDADLPKIKRVIIPADLAEFLGGVTVAGKPILADEPTALVPATARAKRAWLSPVMAAGLFLVLVLAGLWRCPRATGFVLVVVQAALGAMLVYLVFFSALPATTWNWLLLPFNPLPLIFWKWRRYWAWPFAVALGGWLGFMLLAPHRMTHPAYYLLALGWLALYAWLGLKSLRENAQAREEGASPTGGRRFPIGTLRIPKLATLPSFSFRRRMGGEDLLYSNQLTQIREQNHEEVAFPFCHRNATTDFAGMGE